MKPWQRQIVSTLFLVGFVFVASSVFWSDRFPYTHDGENHLIRFVNYLAALREGQWPPRFAPYVFSGYGFPVFLFNYPLANLVAVPFLLGKLHPEIVFRVEASMALFLGAWGTLALFQHSVWKKGAWFATLLYLFSTYLANLLVWRGSIGEMWSYGLAPLGVYVLSRALATNNTRWWIGFSGVLAAMLLSHNLFGLMFAVVWLGMTLWHVQRKLAGNVLIAWILAIGLTMWFWIPALGELSQTVLQQDDLATQAAQNLLSLSQILFSPLQFGFSRTGPFDTLGFGFGMVFVTLIVILLSICGQSLWLVLRGKLDPSQPNVYLPWMSGVGVLTTIWLSSTWSQKIWQMFPMLSIIQFPWRLLLPATFLLVLFGGWFYSQTSKVWQGILLVLLVIQVVAITSLQPADRFTHEPAYYLVHASTTLTRNENRPQSFQVAILPNWEPRPHIATGEGVVKTTTRWTGSRREYQIEAVSDVVVTEPTVYFLGWQIQADEVNLPVDAQVGDGLVAYHLPARSGQPYTIQSRATENTPYRRIGDGLSFLSVLGWLMWWIGWSEKKRKK